LAFSELHSISAQNIIIPLTVPAVITSNPTTFKTGSLRENRLLKRVFERNTDDIMEDWRKLRNEEIYKLYFSSNIIRMIESRRTVWTGA
jgi:hypothetical protein